MVRLPVPGSDDGQWGTLLNDFILAERNSDGSLKIRSDGTLANMYKMPTGGIPNSDLAASVQSAISASASAVQPTDTVAGDLSGTVLAPTVSSIAGVKLSGTPNSGNILSATSSAGAAWVKPYGDLEVFNVRDFGAVGDGVTDDTAAVLSAVAAAKAAGAGVVYLPNGTYGVSATILIDVDGVALVGAQTDENAGGVGSTIAALSTFSGTDIVRFQLAANNRPIHHARVENILIDGKNVGTNVNGLLMRSFRCEVIGVDCANCTGNGFHFAGYDSTQVAPNGWSLYDSYVAFSEARFNGLSGFFLDNNSTDMHFVGLVSHDNTRDGFEFYASSSPQFQSFQPYSNGRFGVSFVGGGSRFKISNGKIEGNGYGGLKVTGIAGSYSIDATLTGANAAANPRALGSAVPTAGCANGLIQNSSFANNSRGKGGSYSDIALGSGIRATSNTIVSNCTFSNAYGTSGQSQYNVYLYGGQAQSNLVIDCMFGGSYKGPIGNYGNTTAGLENMVRQCYGANPDDYVSTTTGSALPSSPALNAGTAPVSGTVYRNVGPFSCTVYVTNMTAVSLIRSTGGNAGGTWSSAASTATISLGAAPGPIVLRAGDSITVTHTSGTWQWVAML